MNQIPNYAGQGEYPDSYYAASANRGQVRASLNEEIKTDICVIGGGYSGLSCALHLTEKGFDVTLVEGAQIGWGASGRNGGQIVNGLNASLDTIEKRYGKDFANYVGSLLQEGAQIIFNNVEKYAINCDLKRGNIYTAYTKKHMQELEAKKKLWQRHGMDDHELLDKEALKKHVISDVYEGGMIDYSGGHMHPLNLALGEAQAIEKNGGKIYENTLVTKVVKDGKKQIVHCQKGKVICHTLIICGNAYLGKVIPQLTARVMPVSTQVMSTRPLSDEEAANILPTDKCVEDVRYILDYYRLSADKRLLFGGGTVYGGSDPNDIEAKLRPNMEKVFPQLKGIEVDYKWSGNFALSFSRVPQMGKLEDNIYFAHGYSGHGVTGTHLFGRILSEAVSGDTTRFDKFASVPWIPFPGGRALRVPYSVVGSWWYGLKDKLGM